MKGTTKRIAICAPAAPLHRELADRVEALAKAEFPGLELRFHSQCFLEDGHFAGSDSVRSKALIDCANDPDVDAVWFAKGGYGSNRIAGAALERMDAAAQKKSYLGYSDCGTLLGALYRAGIGKPVHAPMAIDIKRQSTTIVDGLSATDIGDLPALSIGEALESITGAASHRENGGATEISIRGLGPFLSATTFNGREATNGSGDRSVNFSMFIGNSPFSSAPASRTPCRGASRSGSWLGKWAPAFVLSSREKPCIRRPFAKNRGR
jgi:hypothetical protein